VAVTSAKPSRSGLEFRVCEGVDVVTVESVARWLANVADEIEPKHESNSIGLRAMGVAFLSVFDQATGRPNRFSAGSHAPGYRDRGARE
jgi:hypothetical protein